MLVVNIFNVYHTIPYADVIGTSRRRRMRYLHGATGSATSQSILYTRDRTLQYGTTNRPAKSMLLPCTLVFTHSLSDSILASSLDRTWACMKYASVIMLIFMMCFHYINSKVDSFRNVDVDKHCRSSRWRAACAKFKPHHDNTATSKETYAGQECHDRQCMIVMMMVVMATHI